MKKTKSPVRAVWAILIALALAAGGCQQSLPSGVTPTGQAPTNAATAPEATSAPQPTTEAQEPAALDLPDLTFAAFQEAQVEVNPALPPAADYGENLENVTNAFILSQEQTERLSQDGFVVTPGSEKEFFTVYEKARYANVPIFVTSDSLLHSYHLLFDKVLRTAETEHFIPLLRELNAAVLAQADAQYQALQGSEWEDAARRTVAFLAVGSRLMDPEMEIPAYAADLAGAELELVEAASGIEASPLFPDLEFGEDYTQYIPRGHYTRSEELQNYFKSMMWYGRRTFRLRTADAEAGRRETRAALLLVQALRSSQVDGRPAFEAWADLYAPTVFFVGRSDDLTVVQYAELIEEIYGPGATVNDIADDALLDDFIARADQLEAPRILGMVILDEDDEEETTKGLRFMGQRFVPDAYVFRQLIYRNVGTRDNPRSLPKGLDLLAAMGSERAYQHLDELGDTSYENYPQQMEKVRSWLSGLSVEEWTETLYNAWLYSFFPLLDEAGSGYPAFMQTEAWQDKQLNTVLGSWAELKHDTILYAKQVYAEAGAGPPAPEPVPPKGYVEPVPQFYARLSALTQMTRQGLGERGLLVDSDRDSLQRLENLAREFQVMAEKELRGEPLTEAEYDRIRFYGRELEHLVMASADRDGDDEFAQNVMEEEPQAAVVADVATDAWSTPPSVLEVGVGRINEIHVIVPLVVDDGSIQLQVAKGGVFSYYEFPWPASDRLTDEKWRGMLDEGQAPELPEWTASFYIEADGNSSLQAGVQQYQLKLGEMVWYLSPYEAEVIPGLQPMAAYVEDLIAAGQYEGRQLMSVNFRSFDRQSDSTAVVTVREVWQDQLFEGEYPEIGAQPLAERGPYTLDVTYTLERQVESWGETWVVTQAVYQSEPPEWQNVTP